jgi:hypothetical protein
MGLSVLREAIRPAVAGAGAFGVMFATRNIGLPICPMLTASSYAAFLLMIGGITANDLKRLHAIVSPRRLNPNSVS